MREIFLGYVLAGAVAALVGVSTLTLLYVLGYGNPSVFIEAHRPVQFGMIAVSLGATILLRRAIWGDRKK